MIKTVSVDIKSTYALARGMSYLFAYYLMGFMFLCISSPPSTNDECNVIEIYVKMYVITVNPRR